MLMRWLVRRWKRWTAIFLSLMVAALVGSHWIVGPMLLGQVQALLTNKAHARFTAGRLWYIPPFTLVAYDCHLSDLLNPAAGDLIDVAEIRISLAQFPRGTWRLKRVEILEPTVHVTQTASGIAGFDRILPAITATTEPTQSVARAGRKISDLFQVERFSIENCRFIYSDISGGGEAAVWNGPTINFGLIGHGPADYLFSFAMGGTTPVEIHADGRVNVDDRVASIDGFQMIADIGYGDSYPLPPRITEILRENRVQGLLSVQGSGHWGGRDQSRTGGVASVTMLNSSGLRADGKVELADGVFSFESASGNFGGDPFSLKMSLPAALLKRGVIASADIDASINFHSPGPIYFDPVDQVFAQVRPGGLYHVTGSAKQDLRGGPLQYDLHIASDGGSATVVSRGVELSQVKLDSELFPDVLKIAKLSCNGLGGSLSGNGSVACRRPYTFSGNVSAVGADLTQIAALLNASVTEQTKFKGKLKLDGTFGGSGRQGGKSTADLFAAAGKLDIDQGDLWDVPTLQKITTRISIARKALTVGQAATDFTVAHQIVNLQNADISAPVLGMQGSGTVSFDGQLDLDVVAVGLADWQNKLGKTGVPIISTVAGGIADQLQSIVNKTTSNLLYKFHVTGSASNPTVTVVAAPAITQGAVHLFEHIVNPSSQSQPATETTTQPSTQSDLKN
jgi:hypothetical protein